MPSSLKEKLFAAIVEEAEAETETASTSGSPNAFEAIVANTELPPIHEVLGWRDDDDRSLVHVAAAVGNVAAIQFLVGRSSSSSQPGSDSNEQRVDISKVLNAKDEGGWTALLSAAAAGHAQVVQVLIEVVKRLIAKGMDGSS